MSAHVTTVLVIEDDPHIRRVLRLALEQEGLAVCEAANGRDGSALLASEGPDLVILDLGLPDVDGVALIAQLRTWSAVPVVVLSARSTELQKVAALDSGADDYLTKPFGPLELMARLRVHLRKRVAGTPVTCSFGDVQVDFAARRVMRGTDEVHLTPTEFKLLTVLLQGAGKVLTHAYLLREVWGPGYAQRPHYLRIYMANLRRKLEHDAARPQWIRTETGIGYRLVTVGSAP
jgi:two-component system KDP operon response regulator KdpE